MSISVLPLSYCANVHPGMTVKEVLQGLEVHTLSIQNFTTHPHAVGLWLAQEVIEELNQSSENRQDFVNWMKTHGLTTYTMNTFPYGNFHSERVKENVYIPDWTTPERLQYTLDSAKLLTELLPTGVEGSLSTVPLGFKRLCIQPEFEAHCIKNLLQLTKELDELHDLTGKVVRLAIEPEPLCVLETTAETIEFFHKLYAEAEKQDLLIEAQRHLGVCYDVCHQAVEFEDVALSIQALNDAEIRINKVHITCAIDLDLNDNANEKLAQLKSFAEPRYLHQTFTQAADGSIHSIEDLTAEFVDTPSGPFASSSHWRVHFHVPVNAEAVGLLGTTRQELIQALEVVASLDYAPHLEVETYTWSVLPGEEKGSIAEGIAEELNATHSILEQVKTTSQSPE